MLRITVILYFAAMLHGCSDNEFKLGLPLYPERPVVVRVNESENLVEWSSDQETDYALHWRIDDRIQGKIENAVSPYLHEPVRNDLPVYYSLSTSDTKQGLEAASIVFDGEPLIERIYVTVGDVNGDGCLEVLFAINDCTGNLLPLPAEQMGLDEVNGSGRSLRDLRLADFNGDGIVDLVANSYEEFGPAAPPALLYFGTGGGHFVNVASFSNVNARGRGETIVVADFDNDGDIDIYLPYYTHEAPEAQNYLLLNDGLGNFIDVADEAGVALRNLPSGLRVEGVQALDFDSDGDIDLAAATDLFLNQLNDTGELVFNSFAGFPQGFDEGIKFLDWDSDGDLDVIRQRPNNDVGPQLYEFEDNNFSEVVDAFPPGVHQSAFGLNIYDVNLDGREDVISSGGRGTPGEYVLPNLYINAGDRFVSSSYSNGRFSHVHDVAAFGDFNDDNMPDMVARVGIGVQFTNLAQVSGAIRILVLGANGERNQHGRTVRIRPLQEPGLVLTRVVDGGSGYLSSNQYELVVGTPRPGLYTIEVQFADRRVVVPFVPTDSRLVVYEDGRIER